MKAIRIIRIQFMSLRYFIFACCGLFLGGPSIFADLENVVDGEQDTLFHVAALEGHVFIIKQLIESGADVDVEDGRGLTPLYYAIEGERMEVVRLLLSAGASLDAWGSHRAGHNYRPKDVGTDCESLFHAVVRDGNVRMFRLLMEEAVDLDLEMRDSKQCTPLHIAALMGRVTMMQALLTAGANPHAEDIAGRLPLHYAASSSSPQGIMRLLDAGVDVNIQESWGMGPTPLEIAMGALECGNVCLLKEAGGRIRDNDMTSKKVKELCTCLTPGRYMKRYRDEL